MEVQMKVNFAAYFMRSDSPTFNIYVKAIKAFQQQETKELNAPLMRAASLFSFLTPTIDTKKII
jgi:hypothetical protein